MERPKSITVFGVLNIVFGALGVLGGLCSLSAQGFLMRVGQNPNFKNPVLEQMDKVPFLKVWTMFNLVCGLIASAALLAAGIGLLQSKRWGRQVSIVYAVYGLLSSILGIVVGAVYIWAPMLSQLDGARGPEFGGLIGGIIGGILGGCLSIVYCGLLLHFMTRPRVIAALDPNFAVAPFATPTEFAREQYSPAAATASPKTPYAPPVTSSYGTPAASSGSGDEAVATIIPYRNAPALIAYYLGVFSISACIPFLGIIGVGMAIAAFICGINGLKRAAAHPEAHGRVHAWIGIIGGALCTILGLIVNVGVIISLVASSRH